jgi:hypothetical protein
VRASLAPVFDELEVLARAGGFDAEEHRIAKSTTSQGRRSSRKSPTHNKRGTTFQPRFSTNRPQTHKIPQPKQQTRK